jgi:hypothetical protein
MYNLLGKYRFVCIQIIYFQMERDIFMLYFSIIICIFINRPFDQYHNMIGCVCELRIESNISLIHTLRRGKFFCCLFWFSKKYTIL